MRTARLFRTLLLSVLLATPAAPPTLAANDAVWTQRNDNQRTGAQLVEAQLTPSNVSATTFGGLYSLSVDGTIAAQPLYVPQVLIGGVRKDVLYVATRKNKVYAFDVGSTSLSPDQRLLAMIELKDNRGDGAQPIPGMENRFPGDTRGLCWQTRKEVGIDSTPVIDVAANALYVVYRTDTPFAEHAYNARFYIRKLDNRTFKILADVAIDPGNPAFNPNKVITRTSLLLADGVIYIGFGGAVCDTGGGPQFTGPGGFPTDLHGWVMAFDALSLKLLASLNTTPNSVLGGIWQSGTGLSQDRTGTIWALTGNNGMPTYDFPRESMLNTATELHDAILALTLDRGTGSLKERHFTAGNWYRLDTGQRFPGDPYAAELHALGDTDLASGAPIVMPNNAVVAGGKQGRLYVTSSATMPTVGQSFQAFFNTWHSGISPCDYDADQSFAPNIHGAPVVWHPAGTTFSLIYAMPEKDYLKAFRAFDNGALDERPFLSTIDAGIRSPRGMPGGMLSISANGGQGGIVWVSAPLQTSIDAINTDGSSAFNGRLMAFDALSLRKLWELQDQVAFAKYVTPTIAGGKVFRAAYQDAVIVYGLDREPGTFTDWTDPGRGAVSDSCLAKQ